VTDVADLFRQLTLGVYVIGVATGEQRNAFTAAWLTQISFDPLLLALSVNPAHYSYPLMHAGGGFAVSVLKDGQLDLARHFGTRSGRAGDKLADVPWQPARMPAGAPLLRHALAHFECALTASYPAGDHELALARVVRGRIVDPTASPMLYAQSGELDGSAALYPPTL
jgi:flavin reductase (DIM6/NTAB) family NADH-FMN oxidoreductase RutF